MKPIDTVPLDSFSDKIKSTIRSRGKELRLTIEEASEINSVINQLLLRQNSLLVELSQALNNQSTPMELSGGKL